MFVHQVVTVQQVVLLQYSVNKESTSIVLAMMKHQIVSSVHQDHTVLVVGILGPLVPVPLDGTVLLVKMLHNQQDITVHKVSK